MSNLTVRSTLLTPSNLKEAIEYATIIANSAMVPKPYQNKPGDILVAVQMGAELGLKPIQALQNIAVINGRPSIYGDALLALVQAHPSFEDIKESFDEKTNTAICTVKRKNQSEYTVSFSAEDSKKAGLWGKSGPWTQYPKRMLQLRARGFALRDKFADALGGLITAEEARDYPSDGAKIDITPKAQTLSSRLDDLINAEEGNIPVAAKLSELVVTNNVPTEIVYKWCEKAGVSTLDELDDQKAASCVEYITNKYSNETERETETNL